MPVTLANALIKLADLNPVVRNTNDGGIFNEKAGPQAIWFDGRYFRMWVEAVDNDIVGGGGFDFRTGPVLATADVPQGPWRIDPNSLLIQPNVDPDWENGEVSPSSVVFNRAKNRLELFYHGGNNGGGRECGLLYSTDGMVGKQWVRASSSPILTAGTGGSFDEVVADLKVQRLADGTYLGFYRGTDSGGVFTIGRVTGTSAASLTKQGQVISEGAGGSWNENGVCPGAWYVDPEGRIHMFAATIADGVGYYYSDDNGATWTQYGSNPVLVGGGSGTFDLDAGDVTQGILDGDVFVVSYGGENSVDFGTNPPVRGVGFAITPARVATPARTGRFFMPTSGGTRSHRNVTATSLLAGTVGSMCGRFKAYRTARAVARGLWMETAAFNIQFNITIQQTANAKGGQLDMFFRTPTAFTASTFCSSSQVDDGRWHKFLFRRLATNSFELWIDGNRQAVDTTTVGTDATTTTKSIGNVDATTGEPDNPFQGTVSDLIQVNGYALTWDEAERVIDSRTFPAGVTAAVDFPTDGTDTGDVATVDATAANLTAPPVQSNARRRDGVTRTHSKLWRREGWINTRAHRAGWFNKDIILPNAAAPGGAYVVLTATNRLVSLIGQGLAR